MIGGGLSSRGSFYATIYGGYNVHTYLTDLDGGGNYIDGNTDDNGKHGRYNDELNYDKGDKDTYDDDM